MLTVLATVASYAWSNHRTVEDMKSAAAKVLAVEGRLAGKRLVGDLQMQEMREGVAVMGYDNGGFAVVTTDDAFPEVMGWSEDSRYTPQEVRLKERLNATDLMHFVWNFGERLSMIADGYSGNVRAIFAKSLFPNVMKAEVETVRRNLTTTQGRFTIAIDKPDSGSYEFHSPSE